MPKIIPIYKEAGYLIPVKHLTRAQIDSAQAHWTYEFYDDKACRKCDHLPERHDELCEVCPAFKGRRQLAKVIEDHPKLEEDVLSLPYGNTKKVRKWLKGHGITDYKAKSLHPKEDNKKWSRPAKLKSNVTLKPWQAEALPVAIEKRKGVIEAPPRAGKTLFAAALSCELQLKTLVLAAQVDWLDQFIETYVGSETEPRMTTLKKSQIKKCRTLEDFKKYDVCCATFSMFMSAKGRKLLKKIRNMFPLVFVDEVHRGTALQTSRVLSQINSTYRFGLTGTPDRKQEGLYEIVNDLVGPVFYVAKVPQLRPHVKIIQTGLNLEIGQQNFSRWVNKVEYSKPRLKLIAKTAFEYANKGHGVLVPFLRTKAIDEVVRWINKWSGDERIAESFDGRVKKAQRRQRILDARTGKIKVLVGQTTLLSTGLNIPRASCLIEASPSSNLPNCRQRTARILTPMEGKKTPVIIYVLDDSRVLATMRKNEWWKCVHPKFKPMIGPDTEKIFYAWMGGKSSGSKPNTVQTYRGRTNASGRARFQI